MKAHITQYHIVEVPLSELKIFQWKGKGVGGSTSHFVTDKEWNYTMFYMNMNMEEVEHILTRLTRYTGNLINNLQ
jgi:hypothetical protein